MSELTNQSGNVGNNGLLQQGEAAHDGFKIKKKRKENVNEDMTRLLKITLELVQHRLWNINGKLTEESQVYLS